MVGVSLWGSSWRGDANSSVPLEANVDVCEGRGGVVKGLEETMSSERISCVMLFVGPNAKELPSSAGDVIEDGGGVEEVKKPKELPSS